MLTDLQKSTVPVKTFVIAAAAIISTCMAIMSSGVAVTWWSANELSHINSTLDQHSAKLSDQAVILQNIVEQQRTDREESRIEIIALKQNTISASTRWSWAMQQQHDREEHELNPSLIQPDDVKIHDELMPSQ
jgi:hypothetical protein